MALAPMVSPLWSSTSLSLADLQALAQHHGVPPEDVLLIALNLYGVTSSDPRHRARLSLVLTSAPVVAVPTSVGYGAAFEGLAALLAMLNACAPGVAVVNIDNGYGAGHLAAQIAAPN